MLIGRFSGTTNMSMGWRFNATNGTWTNYTAEYQQFVQAIQNNDYTTAEQLHQQYGFGGKLFDKLNLTTFSQLSQVYTLSTELRQELNMTGQSGMRPFARGFIMGFGQGFRGGFRAGRYVWRHGFVKITNSTTTS